jgi:hypothetical protein
MRVHGMTVTAETEVPGGSPLPTEAGTAPVAALLARLIGSAPAAAAVSSLMPSPPWTGWDHLSPGVPFQLYIDDLDVFGAGRGAGQPPDRRHDTTRHIAA